MEMEESGVQEEQERLLAKWVRFEWNGVENSGGLRKWRYGKKNRNDK